MNLPLIMEDSCHLTAKKHVWTIFLRKHAWLSSLAVTRFFTTEILSDYSTSPSEGLRSRRSPVNLCTPMEAESLLYPLVDCGF